MVAINTMCRYCYPRRYFFFPQTIVITLQLIHIFHRYQVCPRSRYPFYVVTYYIKFFYKVLLKNGLIFFTSYISTMNNMDFNQRKKNYMDTGRL